MSRTPLCFGKYIGNTLPQVILHDPDWFFWTIEDNVIKRHQPEILLEAKCLARKARRINPRLKDGYVLEYLIHPGDKKLCDVRPVRATDPLHQGSSPATRLKVLDLRFAHRKNRFDKEGSRILLRMLRMIHFGESQQLTKRRCEEFFENEANFAL